MMNLAKTKGKHENKMPKDPNLFVMICKGNLTWAPGRGGGFLMALEPQWLTSHDCGLGLLLGQFLGDNVVFDVTLQDQGLVGMNGFTR